LARKTLTAAQAPQMVFFDLGGVLVEVRFEQFVRDMAKVSHLSRQEMALQLQGLRPVYKKFETGEVDAAFLFNRLKRQFPKMAGREQFEEIYTGIFSLKEDVARIACSLKKHVRLSVISNTDQLHYEFIRQNYPVMQHFEEPVTSFQVHALKPDSKIYESALARFSMAPLDTLFIDDLPENIAAARSLGMRGIVFQNAQQLQQDLHEIFPDWTIHNPAV